MKSPSGSKPVEGIPAKRVAKGWCARLTSWLTKKSVEPPTRRVLFLNDDPRRAETFLAECPEAVWVETVGDCLTRLEESWDEIHLDHDLCGHQMVAVDSVDCGMEVIRWLCKEPRDHLRSCVFYVHTHNLVAGLLMVMQMQSAGFKAEYRPFGQELSRVLAHNEVKNGHADRDHAWRLSPRWWLNWAKERWPKRKEAPASVTSES
jgi:hypothetical protein